MCSVRGSASEDRKDAWEACVIEQRPVQTKESTKNVAVACATKFEFSLKNIHKIPPTIYFSKVYMQICRAIVPSFTVVKDLCERVKQRSLSLNGI